MKKLFNLLIILLILYFGIEISFINLNKGHNLEYKIKKDENTFDGWINIEAGEKDAVLYYDFIPGYGDERA